MIPMQLLYTFSYIILMFHKSNTNKYDLLSYFILCMYLQKYNEKCTM